ncbi:MAG: hypothetical protein ACK4K4_01565 [Caldimicrobium sp.]
MLKFDITLIVQIVEALILAVILNFILIKPIISFLEDRKRQFKGLEEEIEGLLREAEEGLKRYHEALNEARKEGIQKREALKEEARRLEKEELSKILKEVEAKKRDWESAFKREFEKLRGELLAQKEIYAQLITEKLLGRKL